MSRLRTHPGEVLAEEFMKPFGLSYQNPLGTKVRTKVN
jgi:plasmid maintenance system antidote protein VapI